MTAQLCELAQAQSKSNQKEADPGLRNLIKKCLQLRNDDVLYDALERARETEHAAWLTLKEQIEEAAATVYLKRDGGITLEVNAFVIPLFIRTQGGLDAAQTFADQPAFELLGASLQQAGLESPKAKVVLISHAYHLDEIDGITFSQLNEMVRDAATAMTDKKISATPAIERSISGWPAASFAADDAALELRFLLGFALKDTRDSFYQVPRKEAEADAWFDARAQRFEQWAAMAQPLVQRCLMPAERTSRIDFLYQDLFHGGKEAGMAELAMLELMASLHQACQTQQTAPEHTSATIALTDLGEEVVLRISLVRSADQHLLCELDKSLDPSRALAAEIDDVLDALQSIGIQAQQVSAKKTNTGGKP